MIKPEKKIIPTQRFLGKESIIQFLAFKFCLPSLGINNSGNTSNTGGAKNKKKCRNDC